jgi:F-type H+-transporting ATPase subunit delta
VDKSLLGGLYIRIGDRVVDSTLKTKLEQMSKELAKIHLS